MEKELQKQKEENERKQKEREKELQKQIEENERKQTEEIRKLKEEFDTKQKEQQNNKISVSLSDIENSISNYRTKISEAKQNIEKLKGAKSDAILGTVMTSIFLPLTLGFSGFGVAATTIERNKINRQIKELENDINKYNNEIDRLENIKEKILKQL